MNKDNEQYLLSQDLFISDVDLHHYKSPIELMQTQMQMQVEDYIMKAVMKVGINVDKEELLKALQYDRNQYDKGYKDGCSKCRQELMEILRENDLYIPTQVVNKLLTVGISI